MAQGTERADSLELIAAPAIEKRIFVVRERQVMLDEDLADLYGVETRRLIEQVKRNRDRFPEDFMFQLSKGRLWFLDRKLRSQTAGRAVAVNIAIMRAFVELRRAAASYAALEKRLDQLERDTSSQLGQHDEQLDEVFKVLQQLIAPPARPVRPIFNSPLRKTGVLFTRCVVLSSLSGCSLPAFWPGFRPSERVSNAKSSANSLSQ